MTTLLLLPTIQSNINFRGFVANLGTQGLDEPNCYK